MKLIEVVGGMIVLFILLPTLANLWMMGSTEVEKRQAAEQLAQVSKAAALYAKANASSLLSQTSATSGPVISSDTLVQDDLLPEGFQGRNVWGQTYQIYFRQPSTDMLQAVVLTTGGRSHDSTKPKFGTAIVPSTASMVGAQGGFIPTGDVPGQSSETLQGAFGGWTVTLAALGIPSPGAGHLGALTDFDPSSLGQDFLYRVAVPGHEELNAMQTELDMSDHAIRGVSELQFTTRTLTTETCDDPDLDGRVFLDTDQGLYICRDGQLEILADSGNSSFVKETILARDGDLIAKPSCPTGTNTTPQIFVSPTIVAAGSDAPPITSFQAWATSANDTQWQVHLRLLTTDDSLGWVYPVSDYGRIFVCTICVRS